MSMSNRERYWRWCSIADEDEASQLLHAKADLNEFESRKKVLTRFIQPGKELNDVLMNDLHLVLPDDMLVKVDSMSMANGLEVRTPFLDYRVAEFAFSIPSSFKTDKTLRKKILHDTFKHILPAELYHRPKRGFEIPLHNLLTRELRSSVDKNLSEKFIADQNLFNPMEACRLKEKLFSRNPGDSAARVWGLLMFQHWWKRWMS